MAYLSCSALKEGFFPYWDFAREIELLNQPALDINQIAPIEFISQSAFLSGQLCDVDLNSFGLKKNCDHVAIWVVPFWAVPKRQGNLKHIFVPIWIPAQLTLDRLKPSSGPLTLPWISHALLEPKFCDAPSIGTGNQYEDWLMTHLNDQLDGSSKWPELVNQFESLVQEMGGKALKGTLREAGYMVCEYPFICLQQTSHVLGDDQKIMPSKAVLKYVSHQEDEARPRNTLSTIEKQKKLYLGTCLKENEVNDNLIIDLAHAISLEQGGLLSIQAPIGCQSQAFISHLATNLWINAAILKQEPPLIVSSHPRFEKWPTPKRTPLKWVSSTLSLEHMKEAVLQSFQEHIDRPKEDIQLEHVVQYLHQELLKDVEHVSKWLTKVEEYIQVKNSLDEEYHQEKGLYEYMSSLQTQDQALETHFESLSHAITQWEAMNPKQNWVKTIMKWLSGSQRHQQEKNEAFYQENSSLILKTVSQHNILDQMIESGRQIKVQRAKLNRALVGVTEKWTSVNGLKHQIEKQVQEIKEDFHLTAFERPSEAWSQALSLLSQPVFQRAMAYFEVKWIATTSKISKDPYIKTKNNLQKRALQNLVLFMPLNHISREFKALALKDTYLDYLILNEGQRLSVQAPLEAIALSQKVLAMGDEIGLTCAPTVPAQLDEVLLKSFNFEVDDELWEEYQFKGVLISQSNAYQCIKEKSVIKSIHNEGVYPENDLLLTGQVDKSPELLNWVNHKFYQKKLVTLQNQKVFENEGVRYYHVQGEHIKTAGGNKNSVEAQSIVLYIKSQKIFSLDEILILTPFEAQKKCIRYWLNHNHLSVKVERIDKVGSSPLPCVILSSVYTEKSLKPLCFDQNPALLITSLMMASRLWIVFGDMAIFDDKTHSVLGNFGKFLFSKSKNQLVNESLAFYPKLIAQKKISGLEEHIQSLEWAFSKATKKIGIATTRLSKPFFERLNILNKVLICQQNQVSVEIFVSNVGFEGKSSKDLDIFECLQTLANQGANVCVIKGLHQNVLWFDEEQMIQGQIPWLALDDALQAYSYSCVYQGEPVKLLMMENTHRWHYNLIKKIRAVSIVEKDEEEVVV